MLLKIKNTWLLVYKNTTQILVLRENAILHHTFSTAHRLCEWRDVNNHHLRVKLNLFSLWIAQQIKSV